MRRIATGRVVKRQVSNLALEKYRETVNSCKKLIHPDGNHLPDEDTFLPDDFTERGTEDNIDANVRALMQR